MNGFYSACTINYPYEDDKTEKVRAWFSSLQAEVQRGPDRALGLRLSAHRLFIEAANKAGKDLNPATLAKSLASLSVPADFLGGDEQKFSAHQAPRLRPRDAVPDPGRQVALGVGVFDELDDCVSRARRSMKWCAADPGSPRTPLWAIPHLRCTAGARTACGMHHPTIYAAPPVAISSPLSFTSSMCATATRLPSRTTRPVAMK